jgi:hypothetical protein
MRYDDSCRFTPMEPCLEVFPRPAPARTDGTLCTPAPRHSAFVASHAVRGSRARSLPCCRSLTVCAGAVYAASGTPGRAGRTASERAASAARVVSADRLLRPGTHRGTYTPSMRDLGVTLDRLTKPSPLGDANRNGRDRRRAARRRFRARPRQTFRAHTRRAELDSRRTPRTRERLNPCK